MEREKEREREREGGDPLRKSIILKVQSLQRLCQLSYTIDPMSIDTNDRDAHLQSHRMLVLKLRIKCHATLMHIHDFNMAYFNLTKTIAKPDQEQF